MKPYFYIIKHKESGVLYCGSRRAKGCDKSELLVSGGYLTSSNIVKTMIDKEGIDAFVVIFTYEFANPEDAILFESEFQQYHDCAGSSNWLNGHNGFGLPEWLKANGVDSCMQIEEIKNRQVESNKKSILERYGVENVSQIPGIYEKKREKTKQTLLERYGVEYNLHIPEILAQSKIKVKKTCLEKYGVDHNMKVPEIRERQRKSNSQTLREKYGIENISQLEEVQNKIKENNMKKYGVESIAQLQSTKDAAKRSCMEKYGVDSYSKTEESRKATSERMKKQRAADNTEPMCCPHCGKIGFASGMRRWHFDRCKDKQ